MPANQTIILVPFERRHLDQARLWLNDPALMRLLDRARPIAELEHEEWFKRLHEQKDTIFFAVETIEPERHIGTIWLYNIDWRHRKAEVRVVIGEPSAIGQGHGTEAITSLCDYAFSRLNLHRLYAYVLDINPRARRAFEKSGFSLEGVLKADRWADDHYCDVFLLGIIRAHDVPH